MPIPLSQIREELYPGLAAVMGKYAPYNHMVLEQQFAGYAPSIAAPHVWVPKLSLPAAVTLGAAAVIIRNPVVTRRFWGQGSSDGSGNADNAPRAYKSGIAEAPEPADQETVGWFRRFWQGWTK